MSDRATGFQEVHDMEMEEPINDLKKENEALKKEIEEKDWLIKDLFEKLKEVR